MIESGAKLDWEYSSPLLTVSRGLYDESYVAHQYIFMQLLRAGADLDILDDDGFSSLDWVSLK